MYNQENENTEPRQGEFTENEETATMGTNVDKDVVNEAGDDLEEDDDTTEEDLDESGDSIDEDTDENDDENEAATGTETV